MRLPYTISTPWSVYGVAFSHDGTRLAIGGGTYFGEGGIRIVDLRTEQIGELACASLDFERLAGRYLTVSSLSFSRDDRYLIASTWRLRHGEGPLLLFEVSGTSLRLHHCDILSPSLDRRAMTGLAVAEEMAVIRYHDRATADMLERRHLPRGVSGDRSAQHLSSQRVVIQGERALTGGESMWQGGARRGLFEVSLTAERRASWIAPRGSPVVTAIGLSLEHDEIVTGGAAGELDAWIWHAGWERRRIAPATAAPALEDEPRRDSIVALCTFPDGDMAAVSWAGMLTRWGARAPLTRGPLEWPGSPRALAAHPDGGWLAIGLKQKRPGTPPDSMVAIVEAQPRAIDPAWRTPRTLATARAAREQRRAGGAFDTSTLGVLADALEEVGCPHAGHVRHHDPRLCACWLVDGLCAPPSAASP